ncbi:outer membrane receptor protein involved in Fe transport [Litorivivens lipolytica]|uniref:Outer membrane receptor protein involved in Fe transport n=1 Tax=Litorivivens lipolytica TaxID=1524264 RepID=A0A7W4W5E9_9GAMM|nr:TonB-dependent receptor [Litorivivens lipolytica]MBB3047157.1 outer membrane receptor protein involved in Fe transport [Litorivivens lipolytica]
MSFRPHSLGSALALTSLLVAGAAYGQSAADPDRQGGFRSRLVVEEVVVRAQRREEDVRDVPIAVTALSGEQLKTLGVADARELGGIVPGLVVSEGGQGAPVYTLRGVGFTDSSYFATPTTAVYLDEVNLPYSIMSKGAIFDVEQVEVLKGPQGTLFGRSTTGGAINFIANKPTTELSAGLTSTFSRFETRDIEGFVSGPLFDGFNYRLAARDIEREEGWQYSNTDKSREHGQQDRSAFRLALEWEPSAALSFYLVGSRWRDRSDAQAGQPIALVPQNPYAEDENSPLVADSVRDYPYVSRDTENNRSAEWCSGHPDCVRSDGRPMDFQLDETFEQISLQSRWYISENLQLDLLGSYTELVSDDSEIPTGAFNQRHAELGVDVVMEVVDFEARLSGSNDSESLRWLLGYHSTPRDEVDEYLHLIMSGTASVVFPAPVVEQSLLGTEYYFSVAELDYESRAPYANVEWQFAETLKLVVGARYTEEERYFSGCSGAKEPTSGMYVLFQSLATQRAAEAGTTPETVDINGCFSVGEGGEVGAYEETLEETSLSYRAVLDWTPADEALLYTSYTRGFKSGSFPLFQTSDHAQLEAVKQEQVDAYELGAKVDVWDRKAHINSAIFYYRYRDKQLLSRFNDAVFGPLPALRNAPKSRVKGVELDFTLTPVNGLYLAGAIAYLETEIREFQAINNQGEEVNLAGREFNYSPKLSYSLTADYSLPVWDQYELGLGVDYHYVDETNSSIEGDPIFAHPDYGVTNARIRFGRITNDWMLTLWGKNILNEYVVNSVHQGVGDIKYRITGMPQTYGLTLALNY